jgi:hypothetical protein
LIHFLTPLATAIAGSERFQRHEKQSPRPPETKKKKPQLKVIPGAISTAALPPAKPLEEASPSTHPLIQIFSLFQAQPKTSLKEGISAYKNRQKQQNQIGKSNKGIIIDQKSE